MSEQHKKDLGMASTFREHREGNGPSLKLGDFMDVSNSFVEAYTRMLQSGMPQDSIAAAMLGATVNVYEMFGLRMELPELLREVADEIESNPLAS